MKKVLIFISLLLTFVNVTGQNQINVVKAYVRDLIIYKGDTLAVTAVAHAAAWDTLFVTKGSILDTVIVSRVRELDNLSDVVLTAPDASDMLILDDETMKWVNRPLIQVYGDMLDTAGKAPTTFDTWKKDTTNGYIIQAYLTDKVGIGTDIPSKQLEVDGSILSDSIFDRKIADKRWLIFGDSFSETLTAYWPADAIKLLGVDSTVTEAKGGATIKSQLDTLTTRLAADANYLDTYEIISLWIGINDFGPTNLGSIIDSSGTATFAGRLKKFIKTIYTNKPEVELYIMTPLPAFKLSYRGYTSKGYNVEDMAVLMAQVCDSLNTPCIDMFHLAGVNKYTFTTLLGADSLHMSHTGRHIVSQIFVDAVKSRNGNKGQNFNYNYVNTSHGAGYVNLNLKSYGTGKITLYKPLNYSTLTTNIYAGGTSRRFFSDSLNNIGIGTGACASVSTSISNIGIGYNAANKMALSAGGSGTTAVGYSALGASTSGGTAFGNQAGFTQTTGVFNVYIGANAGYLNSTGSACTYIGHNAGINRTGGYNTIIGYSAMSGTTTASGQNNTSIGSESGKNNNSGGNNINLGYRAGYNETGSYKTYIAADSTSWANGMASGSKLLMYADMSNAAKSNHFINLFGKVSIGAAKNPTEMLSVTGNAAITGYLKTGTGAIADNDRTPSVASYNTFIYTGSANAVSIDALDDHVVGCYYTIIGNSNTYTITVVDGTPAGGDSFNLSGSSWVGGSQDVLVLYCIAADAFIEVSRSDN